MTIENSDGPVKMIRGNLAELAPDPEDARQLTELAEDIERCATASGARALANAAAQIIARSTANNACQSACWDAYQHCVASCTDKSCINRCFGRYILCVLGCRR
jgi:hypothetical protein